VAAEAKPAAAATLSIAERMSLAESWRPQRDSNPCLHRERVTS
jgi:hypothetical protein